MVFYFTFYGKNLVKTWRWFKVCQSWPKLPKSQKKCRKWKNLEEKLMDKNGGKMEKSNWNEYPVRLFSDFLAYQGSKTIKIEIKFSSFTPWAELALLITTPGLVHRRWSKQRHAPYCKVLQILLCIVSVSQCWEALHWLPLVISRFPSITIVYFTFPIEETSPNQCSLQTTTHALQDSH